MTDSRDADLLIQQLTENLAPVRPATSDWRPAAAWWLAASLAVGGIFACWLGLRADVSVQIKKVLFVLQGASLLLSALIAALAIQRWAIPGRDKKSGQLRRLALLLPLTLGATLALRVGASLISDPTAIRCGLSESSCTGAILALSLLPGALLFVQIRRFASTTPAWSGAWIGLASSWMGAAALGLHCPNDLPLHLLAWHLVLPSTIAMTAGALVGRQWLRW